MKIIEHILKTKSPCFSHEIVPPTRGHSVQKLVDTVDLLLPSRPAWIDVTAHASVAVYQENDDGSLNRKTLKKRPGTIGICGVLQNRFRIDTVAHILCQGFTREETEDALIELSYLGIENVLALRGDTPNFQKTIVRGRSRNDYARDLVAQLSDLRKGIYLEEGSAAEPMDFCVGVAGYPEKHFEAANSESCIAQMKAKVDAGAHYIITQMFFDNAHFFKFVSDCRKAGITVPIVPGLKLISTSAQLQSLPKTFKIDVPNDLVSEINEAPGRAKEIGLEWAAKQTRGLLEAGHLNVHYYVMNDAPSVADVTRRFL